jgi:hypothetical protein
MNTKTDTGINKTECKEIQTRKDFFDTMFMLLRSKKQTFKQLCVFNEQSKDYCYCFEGLIGLALGGKPISSNMMTLPENVCIKTDYYGKTVQDIKVFTGTIYSHLYNKYLPEVIATSQLIKLKDELKLTEIQLDKLQTIDPLWDWWDLNDYIQLNFIQFKLLLRDIYSNYGT